VRSRCCVSREEEGSGTNPAHALRRFAGVGFSRGRRLPGNIVGDIQIPDHPLVNEVMKDVLTEAMDLEGLKSLLREWLRARFVFWRWIRRYIAVFSRDFECQSVRLS